MASSSPSWFDEYMSALKARDAQEKAQEDTYNAYAKLADYTTALRAQTAEKEQIRASPPPAPSTPTGSKSVVSKAAKGSNPIRSAASSPSPAAEAAAATELARLRADLAAAQRSKAALQAQISTQSSELQTLRKNVSANAARLGMLTTEKAVLERKLRDKNEELREKARLIQNVQDEMMSLEIQMNVAEQNTKRLEKENKDIIERFMRRVGQEADEMNAEAGWGSTTGSGDAT